MKFSRLLAFILITFIFVSCTNNSKKVSRSEFKESWPFTVKSGSVECLGEDYVIVFKTNGDTYALNHAAAETKKFKDISEIVLDDPNYPGQNIKMDVSPIEFEALKLCDR